MSAEQQTHGAEAPQMGPITREEDAEEWQQRAKELFNALPMPSIRPLTSRDAFDVTKYQNKPKTTPAEAVQNCADAVEKYDAEECKAYREEIDTLLVFAGLFSAAVTAFTIESYQWLQSDPNDAIIALLSQIAHPANQTQNPAAQKGLSDAVSARINAYWFLSLALSLSAALVAIVCKQWVREFERHTGLSDAAQFISVRQMKLEGFEWWRVATVVAAVPLLLQSALGLFALGLVELLWNLHATVAIVVLIPAGAAVVFYALTTLLPGIQAMGPFRILPSLPQCPFKSPQAMLAMQALALQRLAVLRLFRVVGISYIFIYRKCFVFVKRVYGAIRPASFWGQDNVPSSLWLRLRAIWLADESSFYHRSIDRPNFHQQLQEIGPDRSSSRFFGQRKQHFPLFKEIKSWLRVDQAFIAREITIPFYPVCLRPRIRTRFYFKALSWLRNHVHQPAMESWIFLSIWDGAVVYSDLPRLLEAIRATLPSAIGHLRGNCLAELLILHGHHARLEPGFISEAFIHHLSNFERYPQQDLRRIFYQHTVAPDGGSMFPALHAMLALELPPKPERRRNLLLLSRTSVRNPWPGLRAFVTSMAGNMYAYQSSNLHSAYACLVALYLRELRRDGQSLYDTRHSLYDLLAGATACMRSNAAHVGETPLSAGTQGVFQFLARSVDRCFEQLRLEGHSEDYDRYYAASFVSSRSRGAYLALLSSALGSTAVAREHLERNLVTLAKSDSAVWGIFADEAAMAIVPVELAGTSGQGSSSETIQHTEAQLAGSQPEAIISTGATAAAQSAHVATVAQAAAAAHGTDIAWVSEGSP